MIRIITRVANSAEGDHLHSFRSFDVEAPELEAAMKRATYGTRSHIEVIGAEVLATQADQPLEEK
jgi:hypothetical protein